MMLTIQAARELEEMVTRRCEANLRMESELHQMYGKPWFMVEPGDLVSAPRLEESMES